MDTSRRIGVGTPYDSPAYAELILSCAMNLFLPFGFDLNSLRKPID